MQCKDEATTAEQIEFQVKSGWHGQQSLFRLHLRLECLSVTSLSYYYPFHFGCQVEGRSQLAVKRSRVAKKEVQQVL